MPRAVRTDYGEGQVVQGARRGNMDPDYPKGRALVRPRREL
jgi:hypothetical protein